MSTSCCSGCGTKHPVGWGRVDLAKLERYIRPYWGFIILTTIIKLLGTVVELLIPYLMEIILDHKVPQGDLAAIYTFGGLMILCAALAMLFNILANRMAAQSADGSPRPSATICSPSWRACLPGRWTR